MPFYTTTQLGKKQHLTPEGFLVCEAVPVARTGTMLYVGGEVPVTPGRDGLVYIERNADEVFRPDTLASFEGKAITIDHPTEDVSPDNWQELAHGFMTNLRRGAGIEDDLLLADFVITSKRAIQLVRDEDLREVSCGYEADYEEIEPGRGRQKNIIGNHCALVENGRCGSRCAIGDSMKKLTWMDKLRAAFKNRDEAQFEKELAEGTNDAETETEEEKSKREAAEAKGKTDDALNRVADAIATLTQRVADLETAKTTADKKAKDEEEAESKEDEEGKTGDAESEETEEEKEAKGKTGDSSALRDEVVDAFGRAEILSPGLQMPTYDAAAPRKTTADALCALKKQALQNASTGDRRDALKPLLGGKDISSLTCDALSSLFIGASEIVRLQNNAQATVTFDAGNNAKNVASSIVSINRRNADFWARR